MEQALSANEMLVGIITTLIAWAGFITMLVVLNRYVIMGVTAGAIYTLTRLGDTPLARMIIRHLTDKDVSAEQLYEELRTRFEQNQT